MRLQYSLALMLLASLTASASPQTILTLDAARQAVRQKQEGRDVQSVGSINLGGLNFYRELDLGNRLRVLAISANITGGLLAFRPDGSSISALKTDEITWILLADLDADGAAEVITEEVDGRGTGTLSKAFCIYAVSTSGIKRLWRGESYSYSQVWEPRTATRRREERESFLRIDGTVMTYAKRSAPAKALTEIRLEMRDGVVREVPKSARGEARPRE